MKIACFVWEFEPFLVGGLGVYATEMVRKFVERGNEVWIFSFNYRNSFKEFEDRGKIKIIRPLIFHSDDLIKIISNQELLRWGEGIKLFGDVFSYNFLSAYEFLKFAKKEKFDLIAFHDWISGLSYFPISENIKIPSIFHFHSTEEQRSLGFASSTIKNAEKEIARRIGNVITVSYSMKDFMEKRNFQAKINVVYDGVDTKKFDPKKVKKKEVEELKKKYGIENEKIIFFIGRLTWVKGVHNLVKAFWLIKKEFPKSKLIIVGVGEEKGRIENLIKQFNLEKDVIMRNEWISEKEKMVHYKLADVCVFPSITEPFGIVASEAMAMEKPVVVGASGEVNGFREQVIPNGKERTGVHVDGNRYEDIAWGIKVVLENEKEARKWGKNGRKRVIENFEIEKTVDKTLSIYESLI
ncbi:MAG: glycosyl transferase family 1 [Candidatus Aenigmarchaeota archaeon ex4484_224]|nr:MAG: glycosyl transferase family 1 [Candidatus Aenigmarchaeota archaeon ex4484_224]